MLGGTEMAEWTAKHCEGLVYKVLDGEDHLVAWTNSGHSSLIAQAPRMEALLRKYVEAHACECDTCAKTRELLSEIDREQS
jgi:hypothetical protein